MAGLMEELVCVLEEHALCCERLLELALKKKEAVVKNNVDAVRDIVSAENELVGKAQRMEKKREALFNDIAAVLNKPKDGLTLGGLCAIAKGQPEHSRLTGASDRLMSVMPKLKAANESNRTLIQNALDYIEFSVNVLRTTYADESMNFTESGRSIDIKN
jgi:2C-methyl-D-erythritol 2,4-cyclodiphosphate synthase